MKKIKWTGDLGLNENIDNYQMPDADSSCFIYAANYILGELEKIGSAKKSIKAVISRLFENMEGYVLEDYYIKYGHGNISLGKEWVKKMVYSAKANYKDKDKQKNNLELYYRAWIDGYDPDRIKIEDGVLKVPVDDVISDTKFTTYNTLNSEIGEFTRSQDVGKTIDGGGKNRKKRKKRKGGKNKKEDDDMQTELKFDEEEEGTKEDDAKGKGDKEDDAKSKGDKEDGPYMYKQLELFPEEKKVSYGKQRVIIDRPLGYDREKKSPSDPDMIFDHEDEKWIDKS